MSAYRKLEARFAKRADLEGAVAMLHWDQQVMMPRGGAEARAEQLATLEQLAHEILSAPETGDLLEEAEAERPELDAWQFANLREMRRAHANATALPGDLVAALARATARAEPLWRDARQAADFAKLRPALEEVLRLTREQAAAKGEALGLAPYDALLDTFEAGFTTRTVDALLEPLARFLPDLIERVLAHQPPAPPRLEISPAVQRAVGRRLVEAVGFDFHSGRLDESAHPFCGGISDDVRMTARWVSEDPVSGLMAAVHETGHAMYNAGLPKAWRRQPVGEARGMVVHESQSMLIELQICRSPAFLRHLAHLLAEAGCSATSTAPSLADDLEKHALRVTRGFIRVDADEVTYPLHILLRYRLEKALIAGDLVLADLPAAWNEGMAELVGVVPPDDRLGCLQDIHWPVGAIGYFPCYALGAMLAAQIRDAAALGLGDLDSLIKKGDFRPLMAWVGTHIHQQGSLHETPALIEQVTGRPLSPESFLAHLERRYLA